MEETQINLTGWKAALVILAVLGVTGYRTYARFRTVDDPGREALRIWLVNDYQGRGPAALAQRVADYRAGRPQAPETALVPMNVDFSSLSAHGSRGIMVVRVDITVDGAPPPDGRSVRYLWLTRSADDTHWFVSADSDAFHYYLVLLR
jgi:hypothetical protein